MGKKDLFLITLLFLFSSIGNAMNDVGIRSFDPNRDREAVTQIALDNITRLYSFHWSKTEDPHSVCEKQVMANMTNSAYIAKVLEENGRVQGFIQYRLQLPLYRRLIGSSNGSNAILHHLAVQAQSRGKGYGGQLVQAMLHDCMAQNVNRVFLWTNTHDLTDFYRKHGFENVYITKLGEYNFARQLRPHPLIEGLRYVLKYVAK